MIASIASSVYPASNAACTSINLLWKPLNGGTPAKANPPSNTIIAIFESTAINPPNFLVSDVFVR